MTLGLSAFSNGYSGAGVSSTNEVNGLMKALETGYQTGPNRTGGSALRVESLEASLKVLTFTSSHIKLWKKIPKSPAYSTVEEFNVVSDYGGNGTPFIREAQLPQSSDASYARDTALVKFLGTTRAVSHQATIVHPAHGNQIALENQNGILWLLSKAEQFLFTGDSSLAFSGESEQWNGLDNLIDPGNVIDLAGSSLAETDFEEASNMIIDHYGFATDCFLGTRVMSDLVRTMYPRQRISMPAPVNGKAGMTVSSIATQGGDIELSPNTFIQKTPSPKSAATSANAPATPASIAGAVNAAATNGDHTKGEGSSGTSYFSYVVTAANQFGESAPTAVPAAAVALTTAQKAAGNSVALTITNAATIGAYAPEFYRIYRSRSTGVNAVPADLSDYALIMQVPAASQVGGGTTVVNDVNLTLPFTSTAYLGELTPSVLTFRQLMPMMKMDLAVVGPMFQWMILMYGTPIMFAPKKWVKITNIGDLNSR